MRAASPRRRTPYKAFEQPSAWYSGTAPSKWPPANAVIAKGPLVEKEVVAGGDELWFELYPAPNFPVTGTPRRFDTSDATIIARLDRQSAKAPNGWVQVAKVQVTFTPQAPTPERPHGSIMVSLSSSLREAGVYTLHVQRQGDHVRKSPFRITVLPGKPAELRLLGRLGAPELDDDAGADSSQLQLVAGVPESVRLRTYDVCGNPCGGGGASLEVQLRDASVVRCAIRDGRDGSYELSAVSEVAGSFPCRVLLLRPPSIDARLSDQRPPPRPLVAHELRLRLAVAPAAIHPASCRLVGFPATLQAGEPVCFTIETRDRKGNRVRQGGAAWRLRLTPRDPTASEASEAFWDDGRRSQPSSDGALQPTLWQTTDVGEGIYEARMMCERVGSFEVTLVPGKGSHSAFDTAGAAEGDAHAYELLVQPGPMLLANSDLGGRGMLSAVAGEQTQCVLGLRDKYGNPSPGPPADEVAIMLQIYAVHESDKAPAKPVSPENRARAMAAYGPTTPKLDGLSASPRFPTSASRSPPPSPTQPGARSPARYGRPRGEKLPFELSAYSGTPGCYKLRYRLKRAGTWHLEVLYDGRPLGTPAAPLCVEPAPLRLPSCLFVSHADEDQPPPTGCFAGHMWHARLLLKDGFGNAVALGRRRVEGKLVGGTMASAVMRSGMKLSTRLPPGTVALPLTVSPTPTAGLVALQARPSAAGRYCCVVWVDGVTVPSSLVWLDVRPHMPSGNESRLLSTLEGAQCRALVPRSFPLLLLHDAHGNKCESGEGVSCLFEPEGAGIAEARATSMDEGEGVTLMITPRTVGAFAIHVDVCGFPLKGSPFTLYASPGDASPAHCIAEAEAIAMVLPYEPGELFIRTRDGLGNACDAGGAPLHASISPSGPNFGEILAVDDHGDGTYSVHFVAAISAPYALSVKLGGQPIAGSPFPVHVPLEETSRESRGGAAFTTSKASLDQGSGGAFTRSASSVATTRPTISSSRRLAQAGASHAPSPRLRPGTPSTRGRGRVPSPSARSATGAPLWAWQPELN